MSERITPEEMVARLRQVWSPVVRPDDPLYPVMLIVERVVLYAGHEKSWAHAKFAESVEQVQRVIEGAHRAAGAAAQASELAIGELVEEHRLLVTKLMTTDVKAAVEQMVKARAPWTTMRSLCVGAALMFSATTGAWYAGTRETYAVAQQSASALLVAAYKSGSAGAATWTTLAQLNGDPTGSVAACLKAGGGQRTSDGRAWCAIPFYIGDAGTTKR